MFRTDPVGYFVDFYPIAGSSDANFSARGALLHNLKARNLLFDKINRFISSKPTGGLFDSAGNEVVPAAMLNEFVKSEIFCSSFYKQMGDLGPARDETNEIDLYYKEREWRIIPSALSDVVGFSKVGAGGEFYVPFERCDINMIVVPNEQVRIEIGNYLLSLKASPDARLKAFGTDLVPIVNYDELHRW